MPKISVIIPAYNAEKTIKKTIKSVLNQTLADFELIVINPNSSDSTSNIISQIQDSRLQVFNYLQANVAVNRNRGFSHAKGEFITFLDADDLWTPDKLEAQYTALVENPQAAVVYSWTNCVDETGKFIRRCGRSILTGDVFSHLLLANFIVSGSNVMIRKPALIEVGGFDESLTNAEDLDMWLRLATKYEFIPVQKVQVFYRISTHSKSFNVLRMEKSLLKVYDKAFKYTKASNYQCLKKDSLGNMYKYLSHKTLEASPGTYNILIILKFIWHIIVHEPYILIKPIIYKAFLKLAVNQLLPSRVRKLLIDNFPHLFNLNTFFGYMKIS